MNKPVVWSFTFLNTYDNCARKAQAQYITKETKFVQSPEAKYGDDVHKIMEMALKVGFVAPDFDHWQDFVKTIVSIPHISLEPEMKIGVNRDWRAVDFFASNVWGRGKIDAPIIIDRKNAILFDWKTGKVREDPLELQVQAVLLKAKYPELENIQGAYIWLKENRFGEVYDLSSTDNTKTWIVNTMEKVGQGLFYTKPNALCGWCDLKTCKHWKDRKK